MTSTKEKEPNPKASKANSGVTQAEVERSLTERVQRLSTGVLGAMGIEVSEDTGPATISYRAGFRGSRLVPSATTGGVRTSRSATEKRAKLTVKPDQTVSVNLYDIHHSTRGSESIKKNGDNATFNLDENGNLNHLSHYVQTGNAEEEIAADLDWLGAFENSKPTVSFQPAGRDTF